MCMRRRIFITTFVVFCGLTAFSQNERVNYTVTHLGKNINTVGGESGAISINDSVLIYSSIQNLAQTRNTFIDFDQYLMQVFVSPFSSGGRLGRGRLSRLDFNSQTLHAGNVAYDSKNGNFYFTRCKESQTGGYQCALYVIRKSGGRYAKAVPLPDNVNIPNYTSTQPAVGHLPDGRTILYFSSDRPGGLGGMDLWYSIIDGEKMSDPVNLGPVVNSASDEITPFYHDRARKLFFSSDRENGLGGYDVYCVKGSRNTWQQVLWLPEPVNSEYNDLYFNVNEHDATYGYLTSNRGDSFFLIDSSCCNDIYRWHSVAVLDQANNEVVSVELTDDASENSNSQSIVHNSLFPIKLYFHNDEPDPGVQSDTTIQTYFQTYNRYMFLRTQYLSAIPQSVNATLRDSLKYEINRFFDEEVQGNCAKFEQFIQNLASDLRAGRQVSLLVAGYASPLHSDSYNQHLAHRRAITILNQLSQYQGGILKPYIGRTLNLKLISYGSSKAEHSVADPVYSLDAARERRIEILGVDYQ